MDNKIKLLILEETALGMANIKHLINDLNYEPAALCFTADTAEKALFRNDHDLALVDLGFCSNKDLAYASKLSELIINTGKPFIYLVPPEFPQTQISTEYFASGFLQKPVLAGELFTACQLALHAYSAEEKYQPFSNEDLPPPDYFFIKRNGRLMQVNWENIHCIKNSEDGAMISSAFYNMDLFIKTNTAALWESFVPLWLKPLFIRVNPDTYLNLDMITGFTETEIICGNESFINSRISLSFLKDTFSK